ncbi:translation initiation factor IF-2 [Candidatus Woesearchaeota archaeon]|nr:translation initiation factor IF-2 [Candidatus Woesearchaeota archaeon]
MIRTPIIAFLGHVDAGKTTLQDFIRKTAVAKSEPGEITQSIGASIVPAHTINTLCSPLLKQLGIELKIPGLLMIDTPGHAAFVSLRKRGGTLADLAVLVVDIKEGIMPQTLEAINILKQFKTPFIIAANKTDKISGWRSSSTTLLQSIQEQQKEVQNQLDTELYNLVAKLSELGFNADRFDRVTDYTKTLAIVPCSAKTGEGVPELLVMAAGLSQRFLGEKLQYSEETAAKGTILEVKKEKGLGITLDVIIYDGVLKKGQQIAIGTTTQPIITKIKSLLVPKPLSEMRDSTANFRQVEQVVAATGVKISAPGIDEAVAGMPLIAAKDAEEAKRLVKEQVEELSIQLDDEGIVAKADTLGSLEALATLLRQNGIKVKKAAIGEITRKDISDAAASLQTEPLSAVVIGFNVPAPQLTTIGIRIMTDNVIYSLIEKLQAWRAEEKSKLEKASFKKTAKPCKVLLLKGYVFRQNNPAIAGTEVLLGTLQAGAQLMKEDNPITTVKEIQEEKENITEAKKGKQVAVAYEKITIGRQVSEGDTLYSHIPEQEYRRLKELKDYLSEDEKEALREIAAIMRKKNPLWGV